MLYKCSVCGVNVVENQGDVCVLCATSQNPHTQKNGKSRKVLLNGGSSLSNLDPYGNDMTVTGQTSPPQDVSVPQAQKAVKQKKNNGTPAVSRNSHVNMPITEGITKNITTDFRKKSVLSKWFRTLFSGIPFSADNEVTMFQVFPVSGKSVNALGNACDQVILYGKINHGVISMDNEVEVYGRRDAYNNVIATTIRNRASGAMVTPAGTVGQGLAWIITLAVVILMAALVMEFGIGGIIGAVVFIICLTNLPTILKWLGIIIGISYLTRRWRR